jgi:hypothetical protein
MQLEIPSERLWRVLELWIPGVTRAGTLFSPTGSVGGLDLALPNEYSHKVFHESNANS